MRNVLKKMSRLVVVKLCRPGFEDFLSFLSADPLNLCQVGWGHCQVCLEMFSWVYIRVLAGPLQDIHSCFGTVMRIIIILEVDPLRPGKGSECSGPGIFVQYISLVESHVLLICHNCIITTDFSLRHF